MTKYFNKSPFLVNIIFNHLLTYHYPFILEKVVVNLAFDWQCYIDIDA